MFISWPLNSISLLLRILTIAIFGFAMPLNSLTTIPQPVYSQPCIKNCIITNPFANNVQTWVDNRNNIKTQFSRSPMFPFVGNVTQLYFHVTSLNPNKQLELTHIHITLIKNSTANFNNTNHIDNKSNFITFDNLTASHGVFSLKYRFLEEGSHQIILKINTKDGRVALGEFNIPVLRVWWNLF